MRQAREGPGAPARAISGHWPRTRWSASSISSSPSSLNDPLEPDSDRDRDWFEAHPDRTIYLRPASRREVQVADQSSAHFTAILVLKLGLGMRLRFWLPVEPLDPRRHMDFERLTEADCRQIFISSYGEGPVLSRLRDLLGVEGGAR